MRIKILSYDLEIGEYLQNLPKKIWSFLRSNFSLNDKFFVFRFVSLWLFVLIIVPIISRNYGYLNAGISLFLVTVFFTQALVYRAKDEKKEGIFLISTKNVFFGNKFFIFLFFLVLENFLLIPFAKENFKCFKKRGRITILVIFCSLLSSTILTSLVKYSGWGNFACAIYDFFKNLF